ncbi:MAG: CcmD family protein [Coriobacteriia bacterium]|nr:CcmD family protein [Coriobacteriia bacterium]
MQDVYSAVLPQAPYVIGAYGLIWVALLGYVGLVFSRLNRIEKEISVVEAAVKRREKSES